MKLSTVLRNSTVKGKRGDDKAPRVLGSADKTIHIPGEGPTVQLCGDTKVAGKWVDGQYSLGQTDRG